MNQTLMSAYIRLFFKMKENIINNKNNKHYKLIVFGLLIILWTVIVRNTAILTL